VRLIYISVVMTGNGGLHRNYKGRASHMGNIGKLPPHRKIQAKVFEEVLKERFYQDRKWGPKIDDTQTTPWMWSAYICNYATKWMKDPLHFTRDDTGEFYDRMIQVSAIAAAACESVLRQREMHGKTFYEPEKIE
jgi:hypothetical protein